MTSTGQRADLSKHALGRLLVASPAVLEMLSTRDARHLRRADKALRTIVAEHPWADITTPVLRLAAEWRASFPAATACNWRLTTLAKTAAPLLAGLTCFHGHSLHSTKGFSELPLSVVRIMPQLTALHAGCCYTDGDATVWGEIGRLRELQLSNLQSPSVNNLLGHVGSGLRKLDLHAWTFQGAFSPGFAAVPLLESLSLSGIPVAGSDLAPLTHLRVLSVAYAALQPDFLMHAASSLRELSLNCCRGITNATFAPPGLASLRELTLLTNAPSTAVTSDALVGLASLEVFRSCGYRKLVSQKALNVLGSMGRLRRLLWTQEGGKFCALVGLKALSRCPITEIDLSGSARIAQTLKASQIARLKSLRSLRYSGSVTGDNGWSSLVRISVRVAY